jgi:hypothetical protein
MVAQSRGQSVFIPPSFRVHYAVPVAGELTLRDSFAIFIHRSPHAKKKKHAGTSDYFVGVGRLHTPII